MGEYLRRLGGARIFASVVRVPPEWGEAFGSPNTRVGRASLSIGLTLGPLAALRAPARASPNVGLTGSGGDLLGGPIGGRP